MKVEIAGAAVPRLSRREIASFARRVLAGVRGIAMNEFRSEDVVRHPLVQAIVDAYDRHGPKKK